MIELIHLENFKSNKDVRINLKPLTILSGLNSSGKSTILQALALLRQSHEHNQEITSLNLSGPLITLGKKKDVLCDSATSDNIKITIIEDEKKYAWSCTGELEDDEIHFRKKKIAPPKFTKTPAFQYLQAERSPPKTLYPQAPRKERISGFLGINGEYTADFLYEMTVKRKTKVRKARMAQLNQLKLTPHISNIVSSTPLLSDQISAWLQHISPGTKFSTDRVKDTDNVRLSYDPITRKSHQAASQSRRPINVGFGLTYCLPIITACLSAPKGGILLIENPESHLHPQGQAAMGELLSKCAADGVQIIVETHSDHVINGIRLSAKREIIKAEEIAFHFFSKDLETNESSTVSPTLFQDGRLSNWPDGFFDQWEKSITALIG